MIKNNFRIRYLILFALLFGFAFSAKAATCNEDNWATIVNTSIDYNSYKFNMNGIQNQLPVPFYKASGKRDGDPINRTAYCLDPGHKGPESGMTSFCLEEVKSQPFANGLVWLYQQDADLGATIVAARMLMYKTTGGKGAPAYPNYAQAYKTTASLLSGAPYTGNPSPNYLITGSKMSEVSRLFEGALNAPDAWTNDIKSKPKSVKEIVNVVFEDSEQGTAVTLINLDDPKLKAGTLGTPKLLDSKKNRVNARFLDENGKAIGTKDIIKAAKNGEYTIVVAVKADVLEKMRSEKFYLTLEYKNKEDSINVSLATPKNDPSNNQRMIVFNDANEAHTLYFPLEPATAKCEITKDGKYIMANGKETKDINEFMKVCCDSVNPNTLTPGQKKVYEDECSSESCKVEHNLNFSTCSPGEEFTELNLKEDDRIKACSINKKDIAGNTLNIANFTYCNVACKEEYEYKLPAETNPSLVFSGRYFMLSEAEIKGERKCGTDDIKREKFAQDLTKANQAILNAMNDYLYEEAIENATVKQSRCCKSRNREGDCTGGWSTEYIYTPTSPYNFQYSNNSLTSTKANDYNGISDGGNFNSSTNKIGKISGGCGDGPINANPDFDSVKSAEQNRDNIIKEFNKCTIGWTNDFLFEPELTFNYDEWLYNEKMEKTDSGNWDRDIVYNKDVTGHCSTPNDENAPYFCSGGTNNKNVNAFKCNSTSCSYSPENALDNANVMKLKDAAATYKPHTVFISHHPSGSVTAGESSCTGGNCTYVDKDRGSQADGKVFPVMVTTPQGEHDFSFTLTNNGQYNNRKEAGRLDDVINMLGVKKEDEEDYKYTCKYYVWEEICVDCPPEVVPSCKGNNCPPDVINGGYNQVQGLNVFANYFSYNIFNPNNRVLGLPKAKGDAMIDEIKKLGEEIYRTPDYSFTITPAQRKNIQTDINKAAEANGGKGLGDFNGTCVEGQDCIMTFLNDTTGKYFTLNDSLRKTSQGSRNILFTHWPDGTSFK